MTRHATKTGPSKAGCAQTRWTSSTLNSLPFSATSLSFKRIQSTGVVSSFFLHGSSASSSPTSCMCFVFYKRSRTAHDAHISPLCSLRQYPLYSKPTPPAVLSDHFTPEVYEKSQKYGKHKAKFSIVSGLYRQFIDTLQLASGLYYPWVWRASGQLLDLAGYGLEYQVCSREFSPPTDV